MRKIKLFLILIALLFMVGTAFSYSVVLNPEFYAEVAGVPVSGGKLYTYECRTTTGKTTYSKYNGTANTNPVVLDKKKIKNRDFGR